MRNALRYLWMKLWPLILFMFSCCTDLNSPFAVQSVMIAFQTPDFQIYIRTVQGDKTVENLINGMVPEFSPTEPKLAYYI
jgi:hypothetical protein